MIDEIIRCLENGKAIILPTDTVYGLVCDATNDKAVKRLFKIKRRPLGKPIPIFVRDIKMARKYAVIDKETEKFLKKVWPGKITVVLKRRGKLPKILFGKEKTIGLRMPNYPLIRKLLDILNRPLTGTSANVSGKGASTKIREAISQFNNQDFRPDLIVSVGNLKKSKPSTVIDLTEKIAVVLRK